MNTICRGCATEFSDKDDLPAICPICLDDRQYVPSGRQEWTSAGDLLAGHRTAARQLGDGFFELRSDPVFAIGQRALLVCAPEGNILWDCYPVLDEPAEELIESVGGLRAIAISHPHFFSNMNAWADRFDCPILLSRSLEPWIVNRGPRQEFWKGESKTLWNGMELIRVGGHFAGSTVLRVPFLSAGGALLCGDTFVIAPSGNHVAAMYSYPNKIPLPIAEMERIAQCVEAIEFDSIHAWHADQSIESGAKRIVLESMKRYT